MASVRPEYGSSLGRLRAGRLRLAQIFRSNHVELLHTNETGCEVSAVAGRLAGIRRVLGTLHVDSTYDLQKERGGFRYRVIEHLSNHCLHKAIAVSEATKCDWLRRTHLSADRVVTIPNGVDLQAFRRRGGKGGCPRGSVCPGMDVCCWVAWADSTKRRVSLICLKPSRWWPATTGIATW